MLRPALTAVLLFATATLAACDSAEERAAKHFASAQELIEAGDAERALVELRNVFQLDDDHKEGRRLFARIQRERGNLAEAAASLTQVIEQEPENAAVHAELGELAITLRDWETAARHAHRAFELDPAPALHRALQATTTYREGDRAAAMELARGVLAEEPDNLLALALSISDAMSREDRAEALARADIALGHHPEDFGFNVIRLTLLEQLGRTAEVGAQLEAMVARFPQEAQIEENLIKWYVREGRSDQAEATLRSRAQDGKTGDVLRLARFLMETKGEDAALSELDARIAGAVSPERDAFTRTRAAIAFQAGDRDGAMAQLEEITKGEASDEIRITQVALARMYQLEGRQADAQALIETVLEGDPDMVSALKIRAARLIQDDDTDGAIRDLRRALEQAPRDAGILSLMADAHTREGAHELAGERMALAVQASGNGKRESLRYAEYLLRDDRTGPAESVVVDALRRAPEDRDLLVLLGRVHMARQDFERVGQVAALLERQGNEASTKAANQLRARSLQAQAKTEEAIGLLEDLAGSEDLDTRLSAAVPLIQTYIRDGEVDKARGAIAELEADLPDHAVTRMLRAGLHVIDDEPEAAEAIYRALIDEGAGGTGSWRGLYGLLNRQGREDEAQAVLDDGIEATGAARLMLMKAGWLERAAKDYEGAIALYETLYDRDTGNAMVANNLASMISTYRTGEEDLERAFTIARRLRGTEIPPFQDTYGWLLARRGEFGEALDYLRPAAQGDGERAAGGLPPGRGGSGRGQYGGRPGGAQRRAEPR